MAKKSRAREVRGGTPIWQRSPARRKVRGGSHRWCPIGPQDPMGPNFSLTLSKRPLAAVNPLRVSQQAVRVSQQSGSARRRRLLGEKRRCPRPARARSAPAFVSPSDASRDYMKPLSPSVISLAPSELEQGQGTVPSIPPMEHGSAGLGQLVPGWDGPSGSSGLGPVPVRCCWSTLSQRCPSPWPTSWRGAPTTFWSKLLPTFAKRIWRCIQFSDKLRCTSLCTTAPQGLTHWGNGSGRVPAQGSSARARARRVCDRLCPQLPPLWVHVPLLVRSARTGPEQNAYTRG
eukprot:gene7728-biopygen34